MKTSSSGWGMSKNSPYISCSGMAKTSGRPRVMGWPGATFQTSSRSPASRQRSAHVVPNNFVKIRE